MPEHHYPVPVNPPTLPATRRQSLASSVARHVAPAAAESTRAVLATLAIEQTLARAVTLALGRVGRAVAATPFSMIVPERRRVEGHLITVVTETTIIERITRHR
jgi:hypothetical protein